MKTRCCNDLNSQDLSVLIEGLKEINRKIGSNMSEERKKVKIYCHQITFGGLHCFDRDFPLSVKRRKYKKYTALQKHSQKCFQFLTL